MAEKFLKKIDFLSSPITLFYQGFPSHSSGISGILSIMTIVLIITLSIYNIKNLFNREKEIPISTTFIYYVEDAGTIPLNNYSLFHFITLEDYNKRSNEDFNFSFFNVIGFEDTISNYEANKNITNYNHWLYGYCNDDSDIKGLEDIATQEHLTKSACIRKYFDFKTQEYYDTDNPNFKWPSLSKGTCNPDNKLYSIIIKSCDQNILNNLSKEGNNMICEDISKYDFTSKGISINYIDQYINVINYENPVIKYFFKFMNKLDEHNYSVNHLNFINTKVKTHKGYVFNKEKIEFSYSFDRDDVFTYKKENDIYNAYSFYLNNGVRYYERTYKTILDFLSIIGGVLNIIIFIMSFLNNFFNSYVIFIDINYLCKLFSITTDDIIKANRKNILNKKLKLVEEIKRKSCPFTRADSKETENKEMEKSDKEEKDTITEQSLNTEKRSQINEKPRKSNNNTNNDEHIKNDEEKYKEKSVFNMCKFFIHTITFGKKYPDIKIYENFRKEAISIENLIQTYLTINGLLKTEKNINKLSERKNDNT